MCIRFCSPPPWGCSFNNAGRLFMATPSGSATAVRNTLCESGMACLGILTVMFRSKEVVDLISRNIGLFTINFWPSASTRNVFMRMSWPPKLLAVILRSKRPIFSGVIRNCKSVPLPGLTCTCFVWNSSISRSSALLLPPTSTSLTFPNKKAESSVFSRVTSAVISLVK